MFIVFFVQLILAKSWPNLDNNGYSGNSLQRQQIKLDILTICKTRILPVNWQCPINIVEFCVTLSPREILIAAPGYSVRILYNNARGFALRTSFYYHQSSGKRRDLIFT